MSASVGGEGCHGKADAVRELGEFIITNQIQMRTSEEGVKKAENFADIISYLTLSLRRR